MASLNAKEEPPGIPQQTQLNKSHLHNVSGINGEISELIDDDIHHTVGRLFNVQPQRNNLIRNKKESLEEIVSKAIQAERNHWKDRLQLSMQEIDRQHRIILTTQSGLQDLVKSLRHTRQKSVIMEEEDEEGSQDIDHEMVSARLTETLKFQIRHLKLRTGFNEASNAEIEENKLKQKILVKELREKIKNMSDQNHVLEADLNSKTEKINFLQKENVSLHKQLQKLQKIVAKYNETHSGANFHLNTVKKPHERVNEKGSEKSSDRLIDKRHSTSRDTLTTLELSDTSTTTGTSTVRERTYLEGDQMTSYPNPNEESAIIKDRIRRSIYSARKADYRSSNVAQCLRCQTLFKPAENTHRSCRFHHKGREITEQFHGNGKLDKVVYKWACCKKPLEVPGCCFGYHV
ncbi:hypothetical protein ACF0H5_022717 [Mactra antiquata]